LTQICADRCYAKFIARFYQIQFLDGNASPADIATARKSIALIAGLCAKNSDGTYCFAAYKTFDTAGPQIGSAGCVIATGSNQQCPANCKTTVQSALLTPMGCCFGNWLAFISRFPGDAPTGISAGRISSFLSLCGITPPDVCPRARAVQGLLRLRNLAWAYYLLNAEIVRAKILSSFSYSIGVADDDIGVNAYQEGSVTSSSSPFHTQAVGAGVDVSYSIASDNDQMASSIEASLNSQITQGTLELPTLVDLPVDAKVDATAAVSDYLQNTGTYVPPPSSTGPNSASTNGANFLLVATLFAVASALLF